MVEGADGWGVGVKGRADGSLRSVSDAAWGGLVLQSQEEDQAAARAGPVELALWQAGSRERKAVGDASPARQ